MSVEGISWALKQEAGSPGAKLLLLVLANHADKAGVAYPGRKLIASECECREATVTTNMERLRDARLVMTHDRRRANGSRTSDWVVLGPGAASRGDMVDPNPDDYPGYVVEMVRCGFRTGSGAENVPGSGTVFDPGQVRFSGGPYEPSEEPSHQTSSDDLRAERPELVLIEGGPENDDAVRVWVHYCTYRWPGKDPRPLQRAERQIIVAAIKARSVDEVLKAIDGCWASPFHQGENDGGKKYRELSQIIKGKRGGRTTGEQIDFMADYVDAKPQKATRTPDGRRILEVERNMARPNYRLGRKEPKA